MRSSSSRVNPQADRPPITTSHDCDEAFGAPAGSLGSGLLADGIECVLSEGVSTMRYLDQGRRGRGRSPTFRVRREQSELMARRGMLLLVLAALALTAAMVLATSLATVS